MFPNAIKLPSKIKHQFFCRLHSPETSHEFILTPNVSMDSTLSKYGFGVAFFAYDQHYRYLFNAFAFILVK